MKIYLSAYLNNNLGDDLMISIICNRYKQHQFYISNINNLTSVSFKPDNLVILNSITPSKQEVFKRGINKFLSFFNIPKYQIIKHFNQKQYDLYLELGGSIFMQVTKRSWINKVNDSSYILSKCKNNAIVGCNFGPFQSENFYFSYLKLFSRYDFISFRDYYSYKLFENLDHAHIFPDVVFNLNIKRKDCDRYIVVSVIGLNNRGLSGMQEQYLNSIIQLIKKIHSYYYKIVLMSFCKNEGDIATCFEIMKRGKFTGDNVEVFDHTNLDNTLQILGSSSAIVATRFHANILALLLSIPVLPIIYSKKTIQELEDLSYSGYSWNVLEHEPLDMERAWEQLQSCPVFNKEKIGEAKGHFLYLDKILKYES